MEYIKKDAKIEQKKRIDGQVEAVREKMNKWAGRIVVGGFRKKEEIEHKEGDVWEDNGKTWTMQHGIKQTIRKAQSAVTPWWCPRCGKSLHHRLDSKFYMLRGACHDCVVRWEGKMRMDGVWEIYERREMRKNEISFLTDKINEAEDYMRTFKDPQLHFQDGRWEKLATKDMFAVKFEEYRQDIANMLLRIAAILKDEVKDEDEYRRLSNWKQDHPWENQTGSS